MSKFKFEAKDTKLKDILLSSSRSVIRIPKYQRPYAWTNEQVAEFWSDIITEDQAYFLGSFIFNKEYEDNGFIDVIDGQQRILTSTIFISALRNIAKILGDDKLADLIHRHYIIYEDDEGAWTNRVLPGESTEKFFCEAIQKPYVNVQDLVTNKKEHQRIKSNYTYLYDKISELLGTIVTKEDKFKKIKELRNKLGELIVIDIQIYDEEIAYEIFETVNARGVELSVSDLLKNLIFSKIKKKKERDIAKNYWKSIENNIEETGVDLKKFIRYFWMSRYKFVTEKKLYSEIKKEITDYSLLIKELHDDSVSFNTILRGGETDFENFKVNNKKVGHKIYRSIFATRLMNVTQCNVLFLSILSNIDEITMDPSKVLNTIEKFTFQYSAICKLPGNKVEKLYSKYAIDLSSAIRKSKNNKIKHKNIQTAFNNLSTELKGILPSRDNFIEKFKELEYKNSDSARKLIKYTLEEIDQIKSSGEYKLNFNLINIEHILPQKPKKWGFTVEQVKPFVNSLGNLTLLSTIINSTIGNEVIQKKLPELKKSEIQITKEVVDIIENKNSIWTEDMISDRLSELATISIDKIWKIG